MSAPAPGTHRALAPDLARGLMLLFIALANVSFFLWGRESDELAMRPTDGSALDAALNTGATLFIDARVYPMFAFLFGYGIVQFLESRWRRGLGRHAISRMLVRRHLWLLVFGAVHALLLFEGDILGAYGLTGLILAPLFMWGSERAMKIGVAILAGLIALGGVLVVVGLTLLNMTVGASVLDAGGSTSALGVEFSSVAHPDPLSAAALRMLTWVIATPATVLMLVVPLSVLLGMLAGRRRWLDGVPGAVSLRTVAVLGTAIAVLAGAPVAAQQLGWWEMSSAETMAWLSVSQALGVCGGVGYVAIVALVAQRIARPAPQLVRALASVGKRSLTFYLLQSLVFAPLLSNWGVGLGAHLSVAGAFGLAFGVWLCSVAIAVALERRGARGPAEMLLRRFTYGKFDVPRTVGIR